MAIEDQMLEALGLTIVGAGLSVDEPKEPLPRRAKEVIATVVGRPGERDAGGKPWGPGTSVLVGLKSGSPWKWITAGPNLFWSAAGESCVTVCTQSGQPIAMLASLGA